MSMPGATNEASTHPILQAGVDCGSGSACQPNHYGDFALAPRSPTDLDYMEQNSFFSTHGHAPVVHDRLVTDHHEIHNINVGIKQDGDMQPHVIVDATAETISRRGDAVCIESASAPSASSLSSLLELWEAEIDSILGNQQAVHSPGRSLTSSDLRPSLRLACSPLLSTKASIRLPQPLPRPPQPPQRLSSQRHSSSAEPVADIKYGNGCNAGSQRPRHVHHPWRHAPPYCWRHAPPLVWHREFEPPSHHHWRHAPLHRRRSAPPRSRCLHLSRPASYETPLLAPTFGAMRLHCHVLASINSLTSPLPDLHHHVLGMTLKGIHPPPSPHLQPSVRSQLGTPPLSTAAISP